MAMRKLLTIIGMLLAVGVTVVDAGMKAPPNPLPKESKAVEKDGLSLAVKAEAGKNPPLAWGQPSDGVQAGLSAKICRFTCPADKPGFTGEILLDVVLINTGKGAIAYEPPDSDEALGWRVAFTPCVRGKPIAATIRPGVEVERDDSFKLQAGGTNQHRVRAYFGTDEWIQGPGNPKKGDLPCYGLDRFNKGGFTRVPAVPLLPIGRYTVTVSYDDLKGCQFTTGALKIEIKPPERETDVQGEAKPDAESTMQNRKGRRT
jgi:hypothetical protein